VVERNGKVLQLSMRERRITVLPLWVSGVRTIEQLLHFREESGAADAESTAIHGVAGGLSLPTSDVGGRLFSLHSGPPARILTVRMLLPTVFSPVLLPS